MKTEGITIREAGASEYPILVDIWSASVRATHYFIATEYFDYLRERIGGYLEYMDRVLVALRGDRPVAFAGIHGTKLEMLFCVERGRGIGGMMLDYVVNNCGVSELDVNEQNPNALGFYSSRGFVRVGRSDTDGEGMPYPIIHMKLKEKEI